MSQLIDKAKNYVAEKIGEMPKPTASITDVDFKRVSRESVEYLAKVNVSNPYSTSIPICEITYSFKSATRFCFLPFFQFQFWFDQGQRDSILIRLMMFYLLLGDD